MVLAKTFLIDEAIKIAELGESKGIPLRLMGALAIYVHCSNEAKALHEALSRQFTDIDFMTTVDREKVKKFFLEIGYKPRERFMAIMAETRHIYEKPELGIHVDVFFNELDMCHKIDFRKRLLIDYPTISLADLLLEKLQIVEINEKDVKDVIVLLNDHKIGDEDNKETINAEYIADLLSKDWGFYYTVTTNLNKIKDLINSYSQVLTQDKIADVKTKIDTILDKIEKKPKTMSWKMRAKVGTKVKWYKEVEEI
ncbi:MAG: hypothetical protein QXL69_05085 [Candidatus Bathyarchaeia archaeon]|nr:hypothetical protein [Candidatus Bathyarchaeota archaeon]